MFNSIWPRSSHGHASAVPEAFLPSFLPSFLLLLTVIVGTGLNGDIEAREGDEEPQFLVVSVTDNSPDGRLNTRAIFEAVAHPDENQELFEFLGRPARAASVFGMTPDTSDAEPEYLTLLESMRHYIKLGYRADAGVASIAERIRADDRFNYAQVQTAPGFSTTPNDPFFPNNQPWLPDNENYQWASQSNMLNFPGAWDMVKGWATVGVLDVGITNAPDPNGWRSYVIDHPDLQRVVSYNMSFNFGDILALPPVYSYPARRRLWNRLPAPPDYVAPFAHGTHVVGLIAANANNGSGVAGACWNCSIAFAQVSNNLDTALAYQSFWGSQVINFSGFVTHDVTTCGSYVGSGIDPHCLAIGLVRAHDIVYVASSGNNLSTAIAEQPRTSTGTTNFPARDPNVVGVGGSDVRTNMWNEQYPGAGAWLFPIAGDYSTGPNAGCPDF